MRRGRFAAIGAIAVLVAGLLGTSTVVMAKSPAHPATVHAGAPQAGSAHSVIQAGSRVAAGIRPFAGKPETKQPFDPALARATLRHLESTLHVGQRASTAAGGTSPAVVGPPDPDPSAASSQPAATVPFNQAGLDEHATGAVAPADTSVGMGADQALEMSNLNVLQVGRNATNVGAITLPDFFQLPEQPQFTFFDAEPRVQFDSLHQRWIATEVSWDCFTAFPGNAATYGHGYLDYAISDTPDPSGSWTLAYFYWNDEVPTLPNFGTSTDKLLLTASLFAMGAGGGDNNPGCASGGFIESQPIYMDWSQLGPKFDASKIDFEFDEFADVDVIVPAIQEPVSSPDLRMVGVTNGNLAGEPADDILHIDTHGSAAKSTLVEEFWDLTASNVVPGSVLPPSPQQPGGALTTAIDGTLDSAVFNAGRLAYTATYPCVPTGDSVTRDCVRVTELDDSSTTALPVRLGDTLLGTNGFDDSFGALAFAQSGDLHAVYTRSSGSANPSSYAQYNVATDPAADWSPAVLLLQGQAASTETDWGAYLMLAQDPLDPHAVWAGPTATANDGDWTSNIAQISAGDVGAGYTPIAPVRVLDTRFATGLSGPFVASTPRTFMVAGANGIPGNAVAVTGNLTVTNQNAAGYVTLSPTPSANPSSSTLNFPLGDTRANNVTIALAADGSLSAVYKAAAGHATNLILDVSGYFTAGSGDTYNPISPVRILDTRFSVGGTTLHANLSQPIAVRNQMGIPPEATAITANLTVVGQTHAGYVSLTPDPTLAPATSTINFPVGDTRANGLTIPIAADGSIAAIFKAAKGTANLILDVTGYYTPTGGLLFHPLSPGRRVDTRLAIGPNGLGNGLSGIQRTTPRDVLVIGHYAVPATA